MPRDARYCTHCGPKVDNAVTGKKNSPKHDTSKAALMSGKATSIRSKSIRPKTAVIASETIAPPAPPIWPRRRGAAVRLLFQPPRIDPMLKAARKVEISQAHTTIEEPKCGLS